jgi:hypothetical protein
MKRIIGRVATTVVSLAMLGVAWLALYEMLSYGWRA